MATQLLINAPPADGRCMTCRRSEAKLPEVPAAWLPSAWIAGRLLKGFRGEEVISCLWECLDCLQLDDDQADARRKAAP